MSVTMPYTEYIEDLISKGYAYNVVIDNKTYLLFKHNKVPCKAAPPRMYPTIQAHAQDNRDYVVWYSDEYGIKSPWGTGYATVNLNRRCS